MTSIIYLLFQALTKLKASVLHFAFFRGESTDASQLELEAMVGLILNPQQNKSDEEIQNHKLVKLCAVEGITPLAFALCHPNVSEKVVNWLTNIEDKKLILALNMVAGRLVFTQGEEENNRDYLEPFLRQLVQDKNQTIRKQIFHIVCRHNNLYLLDRIFYIDKVSIYLNCSAHLLYGWNSSIGLAIRDARTFFEKSSQLS
jgi:hypothetical protein